MRIKRHSRSADAGVTLIELLVIIAIIGVLAAALVPLLLRYVDDSRVARAQTDCNAIRTAIFAFHKDTNRWPDTSGATPAALPNLFTLYGAGLRAAGGGATIWGDTTHSGRLGSHLVANDPGAHDYPVIGATAWRGPYIPIDTADPWGRAYEVNIRAAYTDTLGEKSAVHCLSSGPDGIFNTAFLQPASAAAVLGDDVAVRIR